MFFRLAVSSSSKRARGASNFNSAILPAMSLIIEREREYRGATGEFGVAAERVSEISRFLFFFFLPFVPFLFTPRAALPDEVSRVEVTAKTTITRPRHEGDAQTHRPWRACDNLPSSVWNQLKSTNVEGDAALRYARGGGRGGGGWWWCWVLVEDDRWSSWRPLVSALMSRIISLSQGRLHPRALVLHQASPLYRCLLIRCLLLSSAKMSAILSSVSYTILLVSRKIRAAAIWRLST